MINTALAAKVSLACTLLSEQVEPAARAEPRPAWWPAELGEASQRAGQDGLDYAFFPASQRLAVRRGGAVEVYDLSGAGVCGIAAQSGTIVVHTSAGPRSLRDLRRV